MFSSTNWVACKSAGFNSLEAGEAFNDDGDGANNCGKRSRVYTLCVCILLRENQFQWLRGLSRVLIILFVPLL